MSQVLLFSAAAAAAVCNFNLSLFVQWAHYYAFRTILEYRVYYAYCKRVISLSVQSVLTKRRYFKLWPASCQISTLMQTAEMLIFTAHLELWLSNCSRRVNASAIFTKLSAFMRLCVVGFYYAGCPQKSQRIVRIILFRTDEIFTKFGELTLEYTQDSTAVAFPMKPILLYTWDALV